jgi:methyl-accepting chemotaxis protein PixJ
MATSDSLKDFIMQSNKQMEPTSAPMQDAISSAEVATTPVPAQQQSGQVAKQNWWQRLNLRTKATLLAFVIGTAPVLAIGSIAYTVAGQSLQTNAVASQKVRTTTLVDKVNRFIFERYSDIQTLADWPAFSNPKVIQLLSAQEKQTLLDNYVRAYRAYDSIAAFDLKGNVIAQSKGSALKNHADRDYFQQVLKTGKAVISQPEISKSTGKTVVHFAAPIRSSETGRIIGIVRSRMPVETIDELLRKDFGDGEEYNLVDASGKAFVSVQAEDLGKPLAEVFPDTKPFVTASKEGAVFSLDKTSGETLSINYTPFANTSGMPSLKWAAMTGIDSTVFQAPEQKLALLLALGTGATAIAVAALATYLASRATRPIINSAKAVESIGQGKLDTRIAVQGQDELAALGSNINLMAEKIQDLLTQQEAAGQAQMTAQNEITRQQMETADQERQRSEGLQKELMTLLQDIGGASDGDLTVRAAVSAGEIGIVADFFNSIVENLRGLVSQVKQASAQVNTSVGSNETVMVQLADEAQNQALQITDTLASIEQMILSIQNVSANAQQAAEVSQMASMTAVLGGKTMDRTVESIVELRETVTETAQQVKRLGDSSKKISKAVTLINQISLQTNVLAVNASIEAARAGEEGQGFAVVAEEVAALAAQSATATKEIEQIVRTIQSEIGSVVKAMERGTTQVDKGTRQVEEAKESLQQIVQVSQQIDDLLQSISTATVSQTETSEVVKLLMGQINQSSERTSDTSRQVSSALKETVAIAQQLQASVGTFKIEADKN